MHDHTNLQLKKDKSTQELEKQEKKKEREKKKAAIKTERRVKRNKKIKKLFKVIPGKLDSYFSTMTTYHFKATF